MTLLACCCSGCGAEFDAEPEGGHRLMCGDSTSPTDVEVLADGRDADLCFTSPPYAQQRAYRGGVKPWEELMRGAFEALPASPGAQLLVNLGLVHHENEWDPYWSNWIEWMREQGWRRFGWYVWDQGPGLPGDWNGRLAPAHEFIFHFNREAERARKTVKAKHAGARLTGRGLRGADGSIARKTGEGNAIQAKRIPDSVVRVMRQKGGIGKAGKHPAIFPVALVSEMITAFSDAGDIVYEPFSGSGTQIIAAQQNGRVCLAMELAPEYVDVAVRRFQAFAQLDAILEQDGRTYDEIAAEGHADAT